MGHVVVTSKAIRYSRSGKIIQKKGGTGSRRIFPTSFKIKVLNSYRNDKDCVGNQRATARKYGIHRRQIQKWLQCEQDLRNSCPKLNTDSNSDFDPNNINVSGSQPGIDLTVRFQEIPRLAPIGEEQKYWNYDNYRSDQSVYSGCSADSERISPDSTCNGGSEKDDSSFSECKKNASDNIFGSLRIVIGSDDSSGISGISPKPVDYLTRTISYGSNEYSIGSNTDYSRNLMKYNENSNESINRIDNSMFLAKSNENLIGSIDNRISINGFESSPKYPIISSENINRPINSINNRIGPITNGLMTNGMPLDYYNRFPTNTLDYNYNVMKPESNPIISNSVKKIMGLDSSLNSEIGSEMDSYSESGSHSQSDSDDILDSSLEISTNNITQRRSFPLAFKLQVLDYYHQDDSNQRATARKFRINRRQVQKWLGQENQLREEVRLRRGESRQRLTSVEPSPGPVDLRTYRFAYQERPLCLVKPKNSLPKPKKDYITFKPYLDNPVVKPNEQRNDNTCYCLQVPAWGFYYDNSSALMKYPMNYLR